MTGASAYISRLVIKMIRLAILSLLKTDIATVDDKLLASEDGRNVTFGSQSTCQRRTDKKGIADSEPRNNRQEARVDRWEELRRPLKCTQRPRHRR